MIDIKHVYDVIHKYSSQKLDKKYLQSLYTYFTFYHTCKITEPNWFGKNDSFLDLRFYLKIDNVEIATLKIEYDGTRLSDNLFTSFSSKAKEAFSFLLEEYMDNNINDVKGNIQQTYNSLFALIKKKYKKSFVTTLDNISKEAEEKDVIKDLEPIHVKPALHLIEGRTYLSLKIGRRKFYTITSIDSFLSKFKMGAVHKYGKELEFKHVLESLDEESAALVDALLNSNRYYRSKNIEINTKLVEQILKSYQGQYISISHDNENDESELYLIRLEPSNLKINIDRNYVLSLVSGLTHFEIFAKKFVLCEEEKVIDIFEEDQVFLSLVDAIRTSPYPSIEDSIDDFKYNYILRYPDKFIIANEIKEEFTFTALLIKAYFDFDDKMITLEEEIFLDDKQVRIEDLSYRLLAQYRKYRAIITSLGFVDNALIDQSKILSFLSSSLDTLKQYCEVYLSESILSKSISKFNPPNVRIQYESSMLSVFLEDSRYEDEELFAIIDGLRKKKKFILYNNQIISLESVDAERFLDAVDDFHLAEKTSKNKSNKLPIYYAFKALDDSSGISLNEQIYAIFNEIKHYKDNPFKGGKINGELRSYQIEGVKWLDVLYRHYLNGILADDMGLGKTIEIISFLKGEKIKGNVLIICPKSLVFNWKNEFARFDGETKIISIYGSSKERENIISKIKNHKSTVFLTSYDSFRRDENFYNDVEFDTVILDEAQYIKNARAKKTIAVTHIKCDHRFVLTGTPIENSVLDLWSIFNFLMPNYLPEENEFKSRYESDKNYALRIRNYVSPFILRRNKKDVLKDLPDKYEMIMSCEMNEAQRKVYDAYVLLAKKAIEQSEGRVFALLQFMTRLRQICIHPGLFLENYGGGSGKIEALKELIEEKLEEGHRLLIFSQFVTALDLVKNILEELDINHFIITGDTKAEDRVNIANEFNTTKKIKVGLVSLKAGGTGLNLVGADTVIHLDPWWNVAAQDQATDRAHRIGQEKNVEVIKLICEESIEQRVVELQNMKKDLVDKIIADDDSLITSLSLDDIKFILH